MRLLIITLAMLALMLAGCDGYSTPCERAQEDVRRKCHSAAWTKHSFQPDNMVALNQCLQSRTKRR